MKKNKIDEIKIEATLNCIKDSETILNGEYYVIHSDYIIALEEEIEKLNQPNIIVKVGDAKEIREKIELLQVLQSKIDKVLQYIENIKNSDTEIVENTKGKHIDVGYAVPALEDIEDILKGSDNIE